jgi:hypothetical protein
MNGEPSPRRLFFTLINAGAMLGVTLAQLVFVLAGMVRYSDTIIGISGGGSVLLLIVAWRMVSSLPWHVINDPARLERRKYRNPQGPFETVSDGGEKDSTSIPSRNPAPEDLER